MRRRKITVCFCLLFVSIVSNVYAAINLNELKSISDGIRNLEADLDQMFTSSGGVNMSNMNEHSDLIRVFNISMRTTDLIDALGNMFGMFVNSKDEKLDANAEIINEWIKRIQLLTGVNIKDLNQMSMSHGISPNALANINKLKEYLHRLNTSMETASI